MLGTNLIFLALYDVLNIALSYWLIPIYGYVAAPGVITSDTLGEGRNT